jgi:SAM-dependent methyltransferase
MAGYYEDKLHGNRLKRCYEIAPPRIQQYLKAEIQYVVKNVRPDCQLLELGCGYGRVLRPLAEKVALAFGIDTSYTNLKLARTFLESRHACHLIRMDAVEMGFPDGRFDYVICIQNGISAFHVDQRTLVRESIRVTKDHGLIFFSSYSTKIWPARLQWFKAQAEAGLVGEIDWHRTGEGNIVCKDGFTATTVSQDGFTRLVRGFPVGVRIEEVDESSIFCVLTAHKAT